MAGSGTKTWSAGDVLTAADQMAYLMKQVIASYASSARTGAITAEESFYSHLRDTDRLEFYNGSAWKPAMGSLQVVGASAHHSTTQSISDNTDTILSLDSELWDTDTIHDTSTNNSRLTCKTAGKYLIVGASGFNANASGYRQWDLLLNGTTVIGRAVQPASSANNIHMSDVSRFYDLAVNDYVELRVKQTAGTSLSAQSGDNKTQLMLVLVGT